MPNRPTRTGRLSRWIRIIAIAVICVGPIVSAAWHSRMSAPGAFAEVSAHDTVSGLAEYLALRNAAVDRLLPEGAGGTRFVAKTRRGVAGEAIAITATIRIHATSSVLQNAEPVELHERAHLAHAFLRAPVGALLARITAPATDEYAAKNGGEHFGEMAATAWEVLVGPRGVCLDESLVARLNDAEERVPGTAGFVVWYLRDAAFDSLTERPQLLARARELRAPLKAEWAAIYAALEPRRLTAGTFERWPAMTIREHVRSEFEQDWHSDRVIARVSALTLLPSLALLKIPTLPK